MREQVRLEMASLFAGIVALCALEFFFTRMCENVLLEGGFSGTRIVALCTVESFLT